jgi:FADH2 O2-dependent halogenase
MPAPVRIDVAVLGSGFGGSLTALLLDRIGLRSALIDRGRHPRFAIGESSTPVADLVLSDLARAYDLPRLAPLAKYGTWKAAYPDIRCGIKRGFSYFQHRPGKPFAPQPDHGNELLVTASSDDEHSDTHWHRADVDGFFAAEVRRAGLPIFEGTSVTPTPRDAGWELTGDGDAGPVHVAADFLIDASGESAAVLRALGLPRDTGRCLTRSRGLFAHFEYVPPWRDILPAEPQTDHPFPCDHAALHHLIDEGWMWQLRFDSGIVSAGFAIDEAEHPLDDAVPIGREWNDLLDRYPSIAAQLRDATIVAPTGGLRRTGRMQRLAPQMAGPTWALLPNAAGFIDPLHSTGIAQTLCGVERLIGILREHWRKPTLPDRLSGYERTLRREFFVVDRIVAGGYASRRVFPLFALFSMLYFAAATTFERRRQRGEQPPGAAFLCADNPAFRRLVSRTYVDLRRLLAAGPPGDGDVAAFERRVAETIAPYNHAGLCDPASRNMYRYTALPADP